MKDSIGLVSNGTRGECERDRESTEEQDPIPR